MDKQANLTADNFSYVSFSFGILEQGGGCENYFIETSQGITKRSKSVNAAILTSTPKLTELLQRLLTIYYFKVHLPKSIYRESRDNIIKRLGRAKYRQFDQLKSIPSILNEYDVIYSKNEILELVILKYYKSKIKKPIVIGVHTPIYYPHAPSISSKLHNFLYVGKFYKWLLKDASSIKVNQIDDKLFIEKHFGYRNVNVVHPPYKVKVGHQVLNNDNRLRVLFVGRFTEQKGVDILINVIKYLKKHNNLNDFCFKIAGSGNQTLTNNILNITSKDIEYLGHVKSEEMHHLYDWTDVTIIPSRYETLNRVALETAAAGKIAVATNIPGPREIIINNKTGYLVELNDKIFAQTLISQVETKKNNYEKMKNIGLKAQSRIKTEFNDETSYVKLLYELSKEIKING